MIETWKRKIKRDLRSMDINNSTKFHENWF